MQQKKKARCFEVSISNLGFKKKKSGQSESIRREVELQKAKKRQEKISNLYSAHSSSHEAGIWGKASGWR